MVRNKDKYRRKLYERQKGRCVWCFYKMSFNRRKSGAPARDFATFEHLVRRDQGGGWGEDNVVLAHYKCNIKRNHFYQTDLDTRTRGCYPADMLVA